MNLAHISSGVAGGYLMSVCLGTSSSGAREGRARLAPTAVYLLEITICDLKLLVQHGYIKNGDIWLLSKSHQ